jgi:hypothetical protein
MPTPDTTIDLRDLLDDPDTVCLSEYRALHELLLDGTDSVAPGDRLRLAHAMLDAVIEQVAEIRGVLDSAAAGAQRARPTGQSDTDLLVLLMSRGKVADLENIMRFELADEGAEPEDAERRRQIHRDLADALEQPAADLSELLAASFAAAGHPGEQTVEHIAEALRDSIAHHDDNQSANDDYSDEDIAAMKAEDDLSRFLIDQITAT